MTTVEDGDVMPQGAGDATRVRWLLAVPDGSVLRSNNGSAWRKVQREFLSVTAQDGAEPGWQPAFRINGGLLCAQGTVRVTLPPEGPTEDELAEVMRSLASGTDVHDA